MQTTLKVTLDQDVVERVRKLAAEQGLTLDEVIVSCLHKIVTDHNKPESTNG